MLADYIRLDAYVQGIHRAVEPGHTVVDLGCGTGILSMFAAQRNPKKNYAIDHTDIIDLAKRVAQHNKVDCIEFVKVNSREFSLQGKADVIQKKVARSGFVDGINIYFRATFDHDIGFDTALNSPRTNWRAPLLRIPRTALEAGDEIKISFAMPLFHDVSGWSIFLEKC